MTTPTSGKSPKWFSRLVSGSPSSKSSEEAEQDARARRREQVRRAQRTHRDRKATYVKALETEVAKLRAKDVAHDDEIRQYREIIRRLRDLLLSNNVAIPSDLCYEQVNGALAMIEVLGQPDEPQRIRAHMPVFDASAPFPFQRDNGGKPLPDLPSATNGTAASSIPALSDPMHVDTLISPVTRHPYGLDSSQVGVDFVLALEHPCLYHHQLPNPELAGGIGTGHELMLQSPIMRHSPPIQIKAQQRRFPTAARWNVPAIELEKLLSFSEGLDLDGEVTPVQAWQRIRCHPKFYELTPTALEMLRESLSTVVQCYGFGAVIDETYFEQMMERTFGAT